MPKDKAVDGHIHLISIKRQEILVRAFVPVEACTRRGKVMAFENLHLAVGDAVRILFPDDPAAKERV